jgi:hypothetical protein
MRKGERKNPSFRSNGGRWIRKIACGILFYPSLAAADAPAAINFQGKLADSAGNPLTAPAAAMIFRIYDVPSAGAPLFTETRVVPVDNGVFNVHIGSATPGGIPRGVFQGGTERYLGITVGADAEMTPRERLLSVPYALAVASGSVGGREIADSSVSLVDLSTASVDGRYVTLGTAQTVSASKIFGGGIAVASGQFSVGGSTLAASGGRVGVGTASPASLLHVSGGTVTVSGLGAALKLGDLGTPLREIRVYSVTVDPPNLGSGSSSYQSVNVPGLAVGDAVFVNPGVDLAGNCGLIAAYVSAADTLRLKHANTGVGGSCNTESSQWTVIAVRS